MSQYYTPKRTRNIYDPSGTKPFKLSRSKLELFLECPRCFYIDRRLGTGRPPGYPFSLNSAVDTLLKKEFDIYRAKGEPHPLIKKYKINAIPISHENLAKWRGKFQGIEYLHPATNFIITGEIDDLWQNSEGEYVVVDYKATSKKEEIVALDKEWQNSYKRQMEIYQWLLRQNGHKVSDTGYFVYCNGDAGQETFDAKLQFDIALIPYKGSDKWVEQIVLDAHACLTSKKIPKPNKDCDYCAYTQAIQSVL